jgi:WD40 repeat protein
MLRLITYSTCLVAFSLFTQTSFRAQTLSTCGPSPPLPANVKPGVNSLAFTKDGKTLVVAGGDGKIRLLDASSGDVQKVLSGHTNAIYIATFSPDEKLLASSSRDLTARIWDVSSGRELHKFSGFRCSVKTVAFSPNGKTVAASGNDGMIKLWDLKTEKELHSLIHKNSAEIDMGVYNVIFDRSGKKLYAGNGDGTISEWDVVTGKETRNWKAHEGNAFRLEFNRDYSLLASSGFEGTVKLWDTSNWREVRSMSMARSAAAFNFASTGLVFSHDGKLIAASGIGLDEKRANYVYVQAIVWKVDSGEKLWTIEGHKFDANGLTFTRDDKFLLTGSVDRTIKFWDMKTGTESRAIELQQTESKEKDKFDLAYNEENNVTRIMLHGIKIPKHKDNFSVGAAFLFEGKVLKERPCCVTLFFNSFSTEDRRYEKNHNLTLWADGVKLRSGPINYDWNLLGTWLQETMWISITYENFSKLANSKKPKTQLGSFKFDLTREQIEGLRELEARMKPLETPTPKQ